MVLAAAACDADQGELRDELADDVGGKADEIDADSCPDGLISSAQDPGPRQTDGDGLPSGVGAVSWERPAVADHLAVYAAGGHEGTDYVNTSAPVAGVDVVAAADGTVVYIRSGCPQSSSISPRNTSARECGAGWGNHVVLAHEGGAFFTRYAHLRPDSILVRIGDEVRRGETLALMGNTGRSEVRHLHFELGTKSQGFDPCGGNQNFDRIFDVERLDYSGTATPDRAATEGMVCRIRTHEFSHVRDAPSGNIVGTVGDGGFLRVRRWDDDWAEIAGMFLTSVGEAEIAEATGAPRAFVHESQFDLSTCRTPPMPTTEISQSCTLHGSGSNVRSEPRITDDNVILEDNDATRYAVIGWDGRWAALQGVVADDLRSVNLRTPAYIHETQFVDCEPWR